METLEQSELTLPAFTLCQEYLSFKERGYICQYDFF